MKDLEEIEPHFWLTRSVARTVGVSLSQAMAAGALSADDYARMVSRCHDAQCSQRCMKWLGAQNGRAAAPPRFCALLDQLTALPRA